jgi:hypothetical protein
VTFLPKPVKPCQEELQGKRIEDLKAFLYPGYQQLPYLSNLLFELEKAGALMTCSSKSIATTPPSVSKQ